VLVLHAAKLANGQAFASRLQFFEANLLLFARFQALGRRFVRYGHRPVAGNVFLGLLFAFLSATGRWP
jgi:hypothetical protein